MRFRVSIVYMSSSQRLEISSRLQKLNREGRQGRKESWLGVAWRPSRSLRQSLPGCGWSLKLSWDNPQNVVLHFYAYSREFSFNPLLELRDGRRAVLAVEAARIVHQDHVLEAGIFQDGF